MPEYSFKCAKCGQEMTKVLPVSEYSSQPECQGCGTQMRRDYANHGAHVRTDNSEMSDQWWYDAEEQGLTD